MLAVTFQNREMIVTGTNAGIVAVDVKDGSCCGERLFGPEHGQLPHARLCRRLCVLGQRLRPRRRALKLKSDGDAVTAEVAWTTKDMDCHHGGYVIHEGYIYGNDGGACAVWS